MTFDELKEKAHSLPLKPGVYIMQDAQSKVIYVGFCQSGLPHGEDPGHGVPNRPF